MQIPRIEHFIAGGALAPAGGQYLEVHNPATGEVIAEVAAGSAADLDRAVAAAQAAAADPAWRDMPGEQRATLLHALAQRLYAHAEELVYLESISSGGTVSRIAGLDLPAALDICWTMAGIVKDYPFVENLPARPLPELTHGQVVKEPIGVCGLITAWNFPLLLLLAKTIPALAAGNAVVVKPSELTPQTTARFAEITADLLPPGVFNVVHGHGHEVGAAMSRHPDIGKISFTGSSRVGKLIQVAAAETCKRVTLELGGKGAAIVRPDADLNLVAYGALFGVMLNAGQMCESGTRLIVHKSIEQPLLAALAETAARLAVGNPLDPATSVGPLSSVAHGEKVLDYIRLALDEGAHLVCGGERVQVPGCEGGLFIAPTVLAGTNNRMKAAREEIFGPVLVVMTYEDDEEAIALANDSPYGLSAGVWTADLVVAQRMSRRLQAGSVWINDWHAIRTDAPFGGYKESGYGREFGIAGLESFLETKTVITAFQRDPHAKPLYGLLHTQRA
ncbi:aldehyde dehydrogenase family protein [Zestomonas carbonaria]|uniref:NAD/NADP-dependent betaine aldehyde dehydrogenase n=1 Tax=Zestomonas carbonaria TaxID=2762745 RepID=A0A7U7IAM4_9GAMM|nr:aldehyde dehydrogenase family protein [Pseudomonas carbonaria]CAD5109376.1 NAD/NADP-dependent betaine aldehyde dehydrogenase [Pseudomonas carbonaria]